MKNIKKVITVVVIAAAVMTSWGYTQNRNKVELSDLALANVEALAEGEVIVGLPCAQICQNCWCVYNMFPGDYFELPGQFM